MSFRTSLYTDVTANNSLDGNSGFGFQAASSDIDGTDRAHILQYMLHTINPLWSSKHDPLDHPETFIYSHTDNRLYFSRGRSTGQTHSGRSGNQLTEIAVTEDFDDLGSYVPAQCLASPLWKLEESTSTHIDAWPAPLEIPKEFEIEELIDWVRQDSSRLDTLLSLVSGLSDRERKKTILVSTDIIEVLRWWSLGTLLLGNDAAEAIDLHGFAANPFHTPALLVAVHPYLLETPLDGAHVIDLVDGSKSSEIPESPDAMACVRWIRELDTFDALDAINIFRHWAPSLGEQLALKATHIVLDGAAGSTDSENGDHSIEKGSDPDEASWNTGIEIISAMTAAGMNDELETYFNEISKTLSNHIPTTDEELVQAAAAAHRAADMEVSGFTNVIITATLNGLFNNPEAAGPWARALNPENTWNWSAIPDKQRVAGSLSQLLSEVPDADLGSILALLNSLGAYIPTALIQSEIEPALHRVTNISYAHPIDVRDDISTWYRATDVQAALRNRIASEITYASSPSDHLSQELISGVWDFLDPSDDVKAPAHPCFSSWLAAARIARSVDKSQALHSEARYLSPENASIALEGCTLPKDIDVFIDWIHTVGVTPSLEKTLCNQIDNVTRKDPQRAKRKEAEAWLPLASALIAETTDRRTHQVKTRLTDFIEEIPTATEKFNSTMRGIKTTFSFKRASKKDKN